jgi:hypothetical protein
MEPFIGFLVIGENPNVKARVVHNFDVVIEVVLILIQNIR